MLFHRCDPGPCPVCDAPHTTCVAPGTLVVQQLPARDALVPSQPIVVPPVAAPKVEPPVEFTTATYKRAQHGRGRRR